MPRALWGKAPFVLLQHWSIFAAVVCSSALVAMAAAGGPLLRASVESESLKTKLAELTPLAVRRRASSACFSRRPGVRS